jgi:hypothetical protein
MALMLAYVFWHWPAPDQDVVAYETAERDFLDALGRAAPSGFLDCSTFRVGGEAPWLGGAPAYADWYLVQDSAALDHLNEAAVTGVCEEPHYRLTRAMGAGAGSLLQLRSGDVELTSARRLTWLLKPREMPYADLYAALSSISGSLWRRQMVLGPTPEFGILSTQAPTLPSQLTPRSLTLTPVA